MDTALRLLTAALVAQTTDAAATAAASSGLTGGEYALYGGIALVLLLLLVQALRGKGAAPPPPAPIATEAAPAQRVDVETAARQAFKAPQVLAPGEAPPEVAAPPLKPLAPLAPTLPEPAAPSESKPVPKTEPKPVPKPEPKPVAKPEPAPPAAEEAGKTLREGLARTHDGFVKKLGALFGGAKSIDDTLLGDLEEALFTADIGVKTSQMLVEQVHESLSRKELLNPEKVWGNLKDKIRDMLQVQAPPLDYDRGKPFVIMVVGVNGSGKTTTVGKLANQYVQQGKRVVLAAGDTFRAAAVEQLAVWGDRAGVPVIRGTEKQDPSSVIFDACKRAADEGYDVCICDTAGRLQAKKELMDELGKVHRVIGKAVPGAPHEVWLVLDSTNGQNAISQAKEFAQVVQVTGIVMTKLDGTAKGGVVIGICDEMKLPVRYIGIGEKVADLRAFDPASFAEALLTDE